MTLTEIFLTAASLSLDAVAIALAAGALHKMTIAQTVKIAFFFGFFQFGMPLVGWLLGLGFREYADAYGHIVGFALLFFVGLNMLRETFKEETAEDVDHEKHLAETKVLTVMAVATSIDALIVGITFNFVPVPVFFASTAIGVVTFLFSFAAIYAGGKWKHGFGNKVELFGGLVLIALAFKTLLA